MSPPFRPICSAIGMPSYKIENFLVTRMNSITSNKITVNGTFCFAKEILEQDSSLVMGSLDVDSLFTNIPPEKPSCIEEILAHGNKKYLLEIKESLWIKCDQPVFNKNISSMLHLSYTV